VKKWVFQLYQQYLQDLLISFKTAAVNAAAQPVSHYQREDSKDW